MLQACSRGDDMCKETVVKTWPHIPDLLSTDAGIHPSWEEDPNASMLVEGGLCCHSA
jgi:hypothetical protein